MAKVVVLPLLTNNVVVVGVATAVAVMGVSVALVSWRSLQSRGTMSQETKQKKLSFVYVDAPGVTLQLRKE